MTFQQREIKMCSCTFQFVKKVAFLIISDQLSDVKSQVQSFHPTCMLL